jgi:hypothetical protein
MFKSCEHFQDRGGQWGKQDFRVVDPFGFYVRFTEIVDWGQK